MSNSALDNSPTAASAPAEQAKGKRRRGQGQRGARNLEGGTESRSARSRTDRSPLSGWGDGVERCVCTSVAVSPPRAYPVQHRTGVATMALVVVAREPSRILLCNRQHEGPHIWPDNVVLPN